jgi:hypothetical protein
VLWQIEYEERFLRTLHAVGVNSPGATDDPEMLSVTQSRQALDMAMGAGMLRAAATIHHMQGSYRTALQCLLRRSDSQPAFAYIDSFFAASPRPHKAAKVGAVCSLDHMHGSHVQARSLAAHGRNRGVPSMLYKLNLLTALLRLAMCCTTMYTKALQA